MTAIQISVFLENKSGRLAEVTRVLANNGINIRALSLVETIDYGVLRLIVDKPAPAKQVLSAAGFTVTETPVIAVGMPDRPGALADIVEMLTRKDINVEYCYAFVGKSGENAVVIFRIDAVDAALKALQEGGVRVLSSSEVSGV
jgi:hypothetical protein